MVVILESSSSLMVVILVRSPPKPVPWAAKADAFSLALFSNEIHPSADFSMERRSLHVGSELAGSYFGVMLSPSLISGSPSPSGLA